MNRDLSMKDKFSITRMTEQELNDIALVWAEAEGWNPGIHDATSFYAQDPHGFFIGRLGDEPIACAAATTYSDSFAFFGLYLVKIPFRYQGYGMQMTQKRLDYVGERIIGLDGVLAMCDKYAEIGFRPAHMNIRHQGRASQASKVMHPCISIIQPSLFPAIMDYDLECFPAPRAAFLNKWLNPTEGLGLVYLDGSEVKGYGVIRKTVNGNKIGPLFADNQEIAEAILKGLLNHIPNETFFLDTPEPNKMALRLASLHQMEPCFSVLRMYRNGRPKMNIYKIFGITTFELG
ncbi:MAG: GNAT family N-acetyltransferase [Legionellales bacterium]|nr:GNAT family N-acetyltransferase [Legionellales bacterium]